YWWRQCRNSEVTLEGHSNGITAVTLSPDGTLLASASNDCTVKLWNIATGRELVTLKGHTGFVTNVAFSPDGQSLASSSWDQTVRLWDSKTGKELLTLRGHSLVTEGLSFSPDGKRLATSAVNRPLPEERPSEVKIWDLANGRETLS